MTSKRQTRAGEARHAGEEQIKTSAKRQRELSKVTRSIKDNHPTLIAQSLEAAIYPLMLVQDNGRIDFSLPLEEHFNKKEYEQHPIIKEYTQELGLEVYIDKSLAMAPGVWGTFFYGWDHFNKTPWQEQLKEGTNRFIEGKLRLPVASDILITGSPDKEGEYEEYFTHLNKMFKELERRERFSIQGYVPGRDGSRPVLNIHRISQVTICTAPQLSVEELRKDGCLGLNHFFDKKEGVSQWYHGLTPDAIITYYNLPFAYFNEHLDAPLKRMQRIAEKAELTISHERK